MTLKGFVAFLFILDTLHTILCVYSLYWYIILNFGNVANLDLDLWAINIQTEVNGLIGFLVQLFYARRLYIMSKSIVIPAIIAVLGGLCFSLGFVFTVKAFALKRYSHYGSLIWVTCVGMGSTAFADILIALAMGWCLYHKRTGFSTRTDSILMILMTYIICSGLLTSILATGMLISFVTLRNTLMFDVFFWLLGKCYVNSFLAMLNNRDSLRERSAHSDMSNAIQISSIRPSKPACNPRSRPTAVSVTVHRTATADFPSHKHDHNNEPELDQSEDSEGLTIPSVKGGPLESSVLGLSQIMTAV